ELEKRKQLPGETVDAFAANIYELFRRIEHGGNNYPDRVKARMFMERLRPELSMAVSPFLPNTIQDAIDRAKAYKMTFSQEGSLSAYSAEQFMPNIPGLNKGPDTQLQRLINQLANMLKGNNQQNQRPRIQNNANTENHLPVKCFHCNQPGHIKWNCPQFNNNNNNNNNNNGNI